MRSRLWFVAQAVLFVAAVGILPACKGNEKLAPPTVIAVLPEPLASADLGRIPNIVVKFDRPMQDSTIVNSNFAVVPEGAVSGIPFTLQHLQILNEVRIIPTGLLQANKNHTVLVSGTVASAEGTKLGANVGFTFDTINTSNVTGPIAFTTPVAATGAAAGEITLTWTKATVPVTGPGTQDVTTYNIYASTTQGAEDLFLPPTKISNSLTGDTLTGLTPNTLYYIKVQAVDGEGDVTTTLTEISATSAP